VRPEKKEVAACEVFKYNHESTLFLCKWVIEA